MIWRIALFLLVPVMAFAGTENAQPSNLIYYYQTLIAGVLALLAAWAAWRIVTKQINQAERHHISTRKSQFIAARAVMSLALSRLCSYSDAALKFAKDGYDNEGTDQEPPDLPDDIISSLRDIIEFSEDDIASSVGDLVSEIQVQRARQMDVSGYWENRFSLAIYDAAHLYVHASRFFDYARKETDIPPEIPTRDDALARLRFLGYREEYYHFMRPAGNDTTDSNDG